MSDHFDGRRFFNPHGPAVQPFTAVPKLMLEPRRRWPASIDVPPCHPPALGSAAAVVTFVGHSTFLIQTAAGNILTDPMYSQRAGPFGLLGPRRVRSPAVRFDDLPSIAVVLLSHNHYDHCDRATLARLARRDDPIVATPIGHAALLRSVGIRRIEELDWWEHAATAGLPIALTPAHHFSARTPFDRNRALWGGFVIQTGPRRIFFAGDTAYAPFLSEVPRRLGPIDLALVPIGAYEPRWFMRSVHMNPDEAVQAHCDVGAGVSLGMHFGTFQLTSEGIDDPLQALARAREQRRIPPSEFGVLGFGESYQLE